ncbi:hypothetical protein [Streptomyces sp. NPDC002520]
MNAVEPGSDDSHSHTSDKNHPHIRHIVERMAEHHRRVRAEHEEAALEEAIEGAAFDMGADIGHPTPGQGETGYDVDTDLGIEPK